ncbi:organic solute transporter Ostalpha-domain-containing protein [Rhizoctonia solani]|nr:organic solute transporter Ostalpha-domain-containing protein [Rhizoctonia solani]
MSLIGVYISHAHRKGNPWYTGRTGWIVSGIFVLITFIVTCMNVARHARNYCAPREQRQIIRILYMPLVYGGINWLSYRFIDQYVYLSLVYIVYEAFALSAFLYLMIQYVAKAAATSSIEEVLAKKDKAKLPPPWCCFRYRPTKSSFIHMVKWLVFQFVVIRPIVSTISIILQALGVLCPSTMSPAHPNLWLTLIDITSMVTAMYGLLLFYTLTRQELHGHRPLLKFAIIKVVVALSVTQEFVFKLLHTSDAIRPTANWSGIEVADGLNAFALTIEMSFVSVAMLWAYSASEYSNTERPRGMGTQAIVDSINFGDFVSEMKQSVVFFWYRRQDKLQEMSPDSPEPLDYNGLNVGGVSRSHTSYIEMGSKLSTKSETRVTVLAA